MILRANSQLKQQLFIIECQGTLENLIKPVRPLLRVMQVYAYKTWTNILEIL